MRVPVFGFVVVILKIVLEAFAFTSVLKRGNAFAEGIETLSAILAGGGFATDALFLALCGVSLVTSCLFFIPL